jgi:hypothetical protein
VVKIDIHQYAAILLKTFVEKTFTGFEQVVFIGETIDPTVQVYAFDHARGISFQLIATDVIGDEIPQ